MRCDACDAALNNKTLKILPLLLLLLLLLILLHRFNGLFSMTTWASQHQKGKTSPGLIRARDYGVLGCSGISWTICKPSAPRSREITTPTPHHSIQTGCSSRRPTNSVKALKAYKVYRCIICIRLTEIHSRTGDMLISTAWRRRRFAKRLPSCRLGLDCRPVGLVWGWGNG